MDFKNLKGKTRQGFMLVASAMALGLSGTSLAQTPSDPHSPSISVDDTNTHVVNAGNMDNTFTRPENPKTSSINIHNPTGISVDASYDKVEINFGGNPYQGDPNAGMNIFIDCENNEMIVTNDLKIMPDGELKTKTGRHESTYKIDFEKIVTDYATAKNALENQTDFTAPTTETGIFNSQSNDGAITLIASDTGDLSTAETYISFKEFRGESNLEISILNNEVTLSLTEPDGSFFTSNIQLDKSFSKNDFRSKSKPTYMGGKPKI